MPRWDEYFAKAYGTGGFDRGMELGFKKWQEQQRYDPKNIQNQMMGTLGAIQAMQGGVPQNQVSSLEDLGIDRDSLVGMDEDDIIDTLDEASSNLTQTNAYGITPQVSMPLGGGVAGVSPVMGTLGGRPQTQIGLTGISGGKPRFGITPQSASENRVWESWNKQILKNKASAAETFEGLIPIMQNTVSAWKAAAEEKKNMPKGLLQKVTSGVADAAELEGFPYTKAYIGQRVEASFMLNKLITGQNRVIRDVIKQLVKTLPTDTGITEDMEAKVTQSMRNSFGRALGRKLSKDEIGFVDRLTREVLDTPSMKVPTGGVDDFSKMSDEELRKIAGIK